jgi:hypothetical protein
MFIIFASAYKYWHMQARSAFTGELHASMSKHTKTVYIFDPGVNPPQKVLFDTTCKPNI